MLAQMVQTRGLERVWAPPWGSFGRFWAAFGRLLGGRGRLVGAPGRSQAALERSWAALRRLLDTIVLSRSAPGKTPFKVALLQGEHRFKPNLETFGLRMF